MSDNSVEDLIKDVALKHGIALGADDPLLIQHTVNQRLIENFNQAIQEHLVLLREELELISRRWGDDAKEKAERILSVAIEHGRDQALMVIEGNAEGLSKTTRQALRAEIASQIAPVLKRSQRISWVTFAAAGFSLLASITALWIVLS